MGMLGASPPIFAYWPPLEIPRFHFPPPGLFHTLDIYTKPIVKV